MCGIAGYNICLEEAKQFGKRRAAKLTEIGWEFNLHRGIDAHGYMCTYNSEHNPLEDSHSLLWLRRKGSGVNTIKNPGSLMPTGGPVSLATHTRDYTVGSPEVEGNNHPVKWGRTFVTHNGGINNDGELRKVLVLDEAERKKAPIVDSIVFPMLLDKLVDPSDPVSIQKTLDFMGENFDGAYTFHAMWSDRPGLSLIAMGIDRPLVFAYNEDKKVFLYGSEPEVVFRMMQTLGYDVKDKEFDVGRFKQGTGLLLFEGEIVAQFTFDPHNSKTANKNSSSATLNRLGADGTILYDNFGTKHWTKAADASLLGMAGLSDDQKSRLFDIKNEDEWPTVFKTSTATAATTIKGLAQEMDRAYCYYPKGWTTTYKVGVMYYLWKGRTEFIYDDVLGLCDIINWTHRKKDQPIWVAPAAEIQVDLDSLDTVEWLKARSHIVARPIKLPLIAKAPQTPKGYGQWDRWVDKKKSTTTTPNGGTTNSSKTSTVKNNTLPIPYGKDDYDKEFSKSDETGWFQPRILNKENAKTLVRSSVDEGFVWLNDFKCNTHSKYLTAHERPEDCTIAFHWGKLLLCSIETIGDIVEIYRDAKLKDVGLAHHEGDCWFGATDFEIIDIHGGDRLSLVPVEEECKYNDCTVKRTLTEMPSIMYYSLAADATGLKDLKERTAVV